MLRSTRVNHVSRWAIGALLSIAISVPLAFGQAHEHGVAEIGIAVDGSTAQMEFTAPGSAIMGFEHEAKTAADKKKMADAFAKFKANAPKMFLFEGGKGCVVTPLTVGIAEEGHTHDGEGAADDHAHGASTHEHGHADVRALVDVKCQQALKGSTVRFAIKSVFPDLQTLRVQVVGNDFQTGAELKGGRDSVRLSQ